VSQILVLEPDPEIRALYERAITRLGHRAAFVNGDASALLDADVVLVEPGSPPDLEIAQTLRSERPALPIVCASIYPANGFGLDPVAFLEKPFRLSALEHAIDRAIGAREASLQAS
jgi:CheY-like chemotaxis protein